MVMEAEHRMKYLFIDASENSTTAQTGAGSAFKQRTFDTNRNLAAVITDICDQMLADAGLSRQQLELLAVGTGPGSLTGLRVAAGFLRTMAMLLDRPIIGVDVFTWSLQTLRNAQVTGPVKIVQPTLIDKAFSVDACLPDIIFDGPQLIDRKAIIPADTTYALRGQISGLNAIKPTGEALHELINSSRPASPFGFSDILAVLPMYVIPSQAERKFEEKQ